MASSPLHKILVPMVVDEIGVLDFDKDNLPEVEIGGETFCIVTVRTDISVQSADSAALTHDYASRLHIDCYPKPTTNHDKNLQTRTAAAHVFVIGHKADHAAKYATVDGAWSEVIVDTDSLHKAAASSLPLCAQKISRVGNTYFDEEALKNKYKAYIDAINGRNMSQTLPAFCHDVVTHNGKPLPLAQYRKLMEDAQATMPDLEFSIASSLVDLEKQKLAVKINFRGTPVGEFAGVTPSEGSSVGQEVRFSEIVFYWFQDGKIAEVVSLVDVVGYREQVTAQH